MDRAALERRAQELGLPWDQSTTDDGLEKLIRRAETDGSIAAIKAKETVEEPCLGVLWDRFDSEICANGCPEQVECFRRMAVYQTQAVFELYFPGDEESELESADIAERLNVSDQAMEEILEWRRNNAEHLESTGSEEVKRYRQKLLEADPDLAAWVKEQETAAAEQQELPAEEPKKRKKKPPKKKATKAETQARPTPAGSAPSVADPAKRKPRKGRHHAGLAGERDGEWTQTTYVARFKRERERNPLIGQLVPGMQLRRRYKGEEFVVEVTAEGYWLRGMLYPTLYKVTEAITGKTERAKQINRKGKRPSGTRKLCNWSATRFFNLESQLKELLHQ